MRQHKLTCIIYCIIFSDSPLYVCHVKVFQVSSGNVQYFGITFHCVKVPPNGKFSGLFFISFSSVCHLERWLPENLLPTISLSSLSHYPSLWNNSSKPTSYFMCIVLCLYVQCVTTCSEPGHVAIV